jgi:hypothetical protein
MESFLEEVRWEVSDARQAREAVDQSSVQCQEEYSGLLEHVSVVIGTPARPSPTRSTTRRLRTLNRTMSETFPTELPDPVVEPPGPVERHVTFEDMATIVAKVKKVRGLP